MTLRIREFTPADSVAAAACHRAGRPYLVLTPELIPWMVERTPPEKRHRLLLAELDGQVVGSARCSLMARGSIPDQASLNVSVLPEHRGRGVGSALLAAGEAYLRGLGATHTHGWVDDLPRDLGFAERHGYRLGRTGQFASLDLTGPLPAVPPLPAGVELRSAVEFRDDPWPVYLVERDASVDEPGDVPQEPMSYQEWLDTLWTHPDQRAELTVVALVDGEPAAFSVVYDDGGTSYWSAFTATRPAFRGRGLAKLAKTASLHRARAAGLTTAYTNNDASNAPMLAINAWLGYTPCAVERKGIKEL
ncbi:GNAT family N-acetyltransferase [Kitasatospora sp. LaBMicrA B282]|uniref:GNAT family N-acetyltransferase n=1 Tax=Kitasatospora sp. LaBMicrA B282 TaxID=3420949 RepID=UPI003D120A26